MSFDSWSTLSSIGCKLRPVVYTGYMPIIEGPRKKTSPSNFGKIEHCQKHSKFHMQVCLRVLYTDLYLISRVFAFLSIIIVCRNENKVLAAFILHSQPVV